MIFWWLILLIQICVRSASSDLIRVASTVIAVMRRPYRTAVAAAPQMHAHTHTCTHTQPCSLFTRELKWYWTVSNNWKSGIITPVLSQCACVHVCVCADHLPTCRLLLLIKKEEWLRVSLTPHCYLFSLPPDFCLPLSTFCRALRSEWEISKKKSQTVVGHTC